MENSLVSVKDLERIKDLFKKLLYILATEGDNELNYSKNELSANIMLLEEVLGKEKADRNEIFATIKESYQSMYPPHGGLSDFFVWREDFEERRKANQPLKAIKKELDTIFK
jgi:hypothetical protein